MAATSSTDNGPVLDVKDRAKLLKRAQKAALAGDAEELSACFDLGLTVEPKSRVNPPLVLATISGASIACVQVLLDHGWDVNHVLEIDGSALASACFHCNLPFAKFLLAKGADPNCEWGNGERIALHWAIVHTGDRKEDSLELLNAMMETEKVETEKLAAIVLAVEEGSLDAVKLLVEKGDGGLNSSHRYGIGSRRKGPATPLYAAALQGKLDVVQYLLAQGAGESKDFRDRNGKTAREVAEEKGYEEIARLLRELETKAKPS